jgi:hypothetical protein
MLSDDPEGHEQAKARAALLGREVGLEQMMPLVVRYPGPIVGDAEVGPSISPPAGLQHDVAVCGGCIDGIVDMITSRRSNGSARTLTSSGDSRSAS